MDNHFEGITKLTEQVKHEKYTATWQRLGTKWAQRENTIQGRKVFEDEKKKLAKARARREKDGLPDKPFFAPMTTREEKKKEKKANFVKKQDIDP
jgi:hypothetical protein